VAGALDHYKLENAVHDRPIADRIKHIAVPPKAGSVRLDLQLPPVESILLTNVRVLGGAAHAEPAASSSVAINESSVQGGTRFAAAFPAVTGEALLLSRSLVLDGQNIAEVAI